MKRRKLLLTSGSAILAGTCLTHNSRPAVGVEFEISGIPDADPTNIESLLIKFNKLKLTPQYIDSSESASLTIVVDVDDSSLDKETFEIDMQNGKTKNLVADGIVDSVGIDSLDINNKDVLQGEVRIEVTHPDISESYIQNFSITEGSTIYNYESGNVDGWTEYVADSSGNASLVAQNNNVISGTYSGRLDGSDILSHWRYPLSSDNQQRDFSVQFMSGSRSEERTDEFEVGFGQDGTGESSKRVVEFEMNGNLAYRGDGSQSGLSGSWSTGTVYTVEFRFDWSVPEVEIIINENSKGTKSLSNSDGIDDIRLGNDTHNTKESHSCYFDNWKWIS